MKLLYVTSLSGKRINGFMRSALIAAREEGLEVTMACNMEGADIEGYNEDCKKYEIEVSNICFSRNPLSARNIKARNEMLKLLKEGQFDIIHCNTPVGGLIGRICARKMHIERIIYMAHGFHFWQGAPIKNWILYYPIEKWLSGITSTLITITKEDFEMAKKMNAKKVEYVHGVGVDIASFNKPLSIEERMSLRKKFGIEEKDKVLLSVGELNENKNHLPVINAVIEMNDPSIKYIICGDGPLRNKYKEIIHDNKMENNIFLPGFCDNINEYYKVADCFVFPSLREGIPASIMEAMASYVPVIASDIRGIRDLITDKRCLFNPNSQESIRQSIEFCLYNNMEQIIEINRENLKPYELSNVVTELRKIYKSIQ